jgi:hypothetical protein
VPLDMKFVEPYRRMRCVCDGGATKPIPHTHNPQTDSDRLARPPAKRRNFLCRLSVNRPRHTRLASRGSCRLTSMHRSGGYPDIVHSSQDFETTRNSYTYG